jgi:hypothetical protein
VDFMGSSARFMKPQKKIDKPVNPPRSVADAILANHAGRFPHITGLLMTPTLREDGSILVTPGYDEKTGYYLICPELDDQLTFAEESPAEALKVVEDIIHEFPFATESDRANMLALILTAVIRPAIKGPTPLFVINAPVVASGKTLLAKVTSILEGRSGSVIDVPDKDDELMKRLHAHMLDTGGSGVMVLDNHPSDKRLTSDSLASLITGDSQSIRRLGSSDMYLVRNNSTVIVTGNNIQVGGDITRRVVEIRIEPKVPEPEKRDGFVHPNLIGYVQKHRLGLVKSVLSLARCWFEAEQPLPTCPNFGSFEEWRRIVGGILEYAGVTGLLGNRERISETAGLDAAQWEEFLQAIRKSNSDSSFTTAEIVAELANRDCTLSPEHLPEDLREKYDERSPGFKNSLGKAFAARVGRRYNDKGLRVERASTKHGKSCWRIVTGN